jgi:proteasome accessory factor A
MGGETEFGLSALRVGGHAVEQRVFLPQFMAHARASLPFTTISKNGRFVGNGGMLYLDNGLYIEWSTPEVTSPRDMVRYLRAGDDLVHRLACDLLRATPDLSNVFCTRCNVDYFDKTQWASHESYLHNSKPADLPSQMLPFLASRVVMCGAGGWDCTAPGLRFTLSPRAHVITEITGVGTQSARPLFHLKDEKLSTTGSHRLHVCCSETLCSDTGTLLRFGATALVLALIDAGGQLGDAVTLTSPLTALRRFAGDPRCRSRASIRDGRNLTAIDIQRHYLGQVELMWASKVGERLPDWAGEICRVWRRTLDDLEAGPVQVEATLDWAIKRKLFEHHLEKHGISWASLANWNFVIRHLERLWLAEPVDRGPFNFNLSVVMEWAMTEPVRRRLQPLLDGRQLDWNQLPVLIKARSELFEIDTRFGGLGDDGIFRALDARGVLKHCVIGLDLTGAVETPPLGTRARIRGDVVRRFTACGTKYIAEWTRIFDVDTKRVLDLGDPFETEERWRSASELGVVREEGRGVLPLATPGDRRLSARPPALH